MTKTFTIGLMLALLAILTLSGCYTQLQSSRDRDYREYETYSDNEYAPNESDTAYYEGEDGEEGQTIVNNYYGDDWRYRVGFSYYYPPMWSPSAYFSAAYYDPWAWSYYTPGWGYYSYNPYYYYPPVYYYPYYGFYGGYYYDRDNYPIRRQVRDFGSTRSGGRSGRVGGATRSGETMDGYSNPGRSGRDGGGSGVDLPRVSQTRSGSGSSSEPGKVSSGTKSTRREGARSGSTNGTYQPRPGGKRSGEGVRSGGSSRPSTGSGRSREESGRTSSPPPSYNPPPSNPPSSSSPPASSGRSGGSSGSSSSGGRSGGRRP